MATKKDVNRFCRGQIVRSKAGHDQGKLYVILDIEKDYVLLADGVLKMIDHPKRKNIRHVERMNYIDSCIDAKLNGQCALSNEDILNAIQLYEQDAK